MAIFKDRTHAGQVLAKRLVRYSAQNDVLVLALPRGGVPVAFEIARELSAPLDVFLVRKLGLPGHPELAMGAIASGGIRVLNEDVVRGLSVPENVIASVAESELQELRRREQAYRGEQPGLDVHGKTIILVDDGLATGASMRAAIAGLKAQSPGRIIVAVPTASPETCGEFESEVDEILCAVTPQPFFGVGIWYDDFSQTTDEEVRELLEKSKTWLKREE
jgi:putative phosphoribosyl transferase